VVHANNFAAHFDYGGTLSSSSLKDLSYKLNCVLPFDIAVQKIEMVKPDVHARFSATSRTYQYLITTVKNPFLVNRAWFLNQSLDVKAMQQAASELLNYQCFESFCKSNSGVSNYNCKILMANWLQEETLLKFEITADRFLRNMVRALVGTIVDVGLRKITIAEFKKIIESRNRSNAGLSVPACGLYLEGVTYPSDYIIVGNLK
jgi:tRNA pseudouridine38-40 synthase